MDSFYEGVVARLAERFSSEAVGASLGALAASALTAALTFGVFYAAWRALDRLLPVLMAKTGLDATARAFARSIAKYTLLTIGIVTAVGELGINTTSLAASLGIAGLTVGFAARDSLSNIISGLFIYWDRPFVIGDLIDVSDHYGRVDRITLRSTRVITPDGRMLAIPNSEALNSIVASYTNFPHLRIDVDVNVGVDEDLSRVRDLLLQVVRDDPDFLEDPAPDVALTALGDYANTVELRAWLDLERKHLAKRARLREKVYDVLDAEEVEMPFETLQLRPVEVRRTA
jgi:small conductance mechanosensitive channel